MPYTTATEDALSIRNALKAKGWTSRQVSVRSEYFSGGSSIDLIIKDPAIPLHVVKDIAEDKEKIDRCHVSGEILSGSNRYVSVRYSDAAEEALAAPLVGALTAAAAKIPEGDDSSGRDVDGMPGVVIFRGRWGHGFVVYHGDTRLMESMTIKHAAYTLAVSLQRKP